MRILISNDDGIYSPGIRALAEVARELGDVRIVAPDVEQSAMGHAVTLSRPLRYRKTRIGDFEAYRVNGTPADCVALGTSQWSDVALVLSGINLGMNLGNSTWHSGTLAAAKQAALLGFRGVALSAPPTHDEPSDYDMLRPFVKKVLEIIVSKPELSLVNVNFPNQEPRGIRWTRQSVRHYDGHVVPAEDPRGHRIYWFTSRPLEEPDEGTDRWAIDHGFVSMTPLRLDLTSERDLENALRESALTGA